jgi:hypothetical protein
MPKKKSKRAEQPAEPPKAEWDVKDDFAKIGPLSIDGVEARDLPDKGRGSIETEPGHEGKRKIPHD